MAEIVIYNDLNTGLQERGYKLDISNDSNKELVWQGNSWADLINTFGFDESYVGGLINTNGVISFDQTMQNNNVLKPPKMGRDLSSYLEEQLSLTFQDDNKDIEIITKLGGLRDYLHSAACNPISNQRLDNIVTNLQSNASFLGISTADLTAIGGLINAWRNS